jgi:predicted nucleic acid-binding protein
MTPCVGDTGPFLHLHEIDHLFLLRLFPRVEIPPAVAEELASFGVGPDGLAAAGLTVPVSVPSSAGLIAIAAQAEELGLQEADRAVLALALDVQATTVLTDDLDLREACRRLTITPVGTVGILFRGFATNQLDRAGLERALHRLFDESTLHLSPAFRAYILDRLRSIPG